MTTYKTIADLPSGTASATDDLEVSQSGTSRRVTLDQVSGVVLATVSETIDDRVAALLVAGPNVTLDYNDAANSLTIASTAAGGGGGTVTSASVASANGFAGTVATATTTPAITMRTTISGLLKGNATAISAAVAGTDYVVPGALASYLPLTGGTLSGPGTLAGTSATMSTAIAAASNDTTVATTAWVKTNMSAAPPSILLYLSAATVAVTATATAVNWNVTGENTTGGSYSAGAFTVPAGLGGLWDVAISFQMLAATTLMSGRAALFVNGTAVADSTTYCGDSVGGTARITGKFRLAVADVVTARVSVNSSTGTLYGTTSGVRNSWLHLTRIAA